MIIQDNFVYIHTPKTAGTSLHKVFRERYGLDGEATLHDTYVDVPEECRDGRFVFGFMRNPLHAEASLWKYSSTFWHQHVGDKPWMDFETWCRWRYEEEEHWGLQWLQPHQLHYGHTFNVRPSAGYFCDEGGRCRATKIYRFEELTQSLRDASARIGYDLSLIEGKEADTMTFGWSRGKFDYDSVITPRSEEILRSVKAIDFQLWESPGDIFCHYSCPTVPHYAYSR